MMNPKPAHIPAHYIEGWKAVQPDLTTRHGFRWHPRTIVRSDHNPVASNATACPAHQGDGLCIAKTWAGAASAGFTTHVCLTVWYNPQLVAGEDKDKLRVLGEVHIGDPYDAQRMIRDGWLKGGDLSYANLSYANLYDVNLRGANLHGANLQGTNLSGADLYGADLSGATLSGANLTHAYLQHASLHNANLRGAILYATNLFGADFYGAELYGTNLATANLRRADLRHADLRGANLKGTNFAESLQLDTRWPENRDQ